MIPKLTKIVNYEDSLLKTKTTITGVNQSYLQRRGDYELVIFKLNPHCKQKLHYHTYGDIDIFIVVAGSGCLRLAKIEKDKIVPETEEELFIKKGDTYCIEPYVLHGLETRDESITVFNIAPGGHSALADGEKYQRGVDIFFPQ